MELSVERGVAPINENILSITAEQSVENDVMLADYYPSIVRVLRCHVETSADQCVLSGDRLVIDGTAVCHVHYKAEDGGLAKISIKIPYSKTVDIKSPHGNVMVRAEAAPGYFACRVVNPRRLDLRGAVLLKCTVFVSEEQEIVRDAVGTSMQCRCSDKTCAELLQWTGKSFMIRGEYELGEGKPAPSRILKCSANPGETTFKAVGGKLIAKCEALVKIMYCCAENKIHHGEIKVPISEIIDVEGLDERCVSTVSFKVCWCDAQARDSLTATSQPMVAVEICALASVCAVRNNLCKMMTDCYCTRFETKTETKPMPIAGALPPLHSCMAVEEKLDMPPEVSEILELWADMTEYFVSAENNSLNISGKLQVCMLAKLENGEPEYFDHMQDFEKTLPMSGLGDSPELFAFCTVGSTAFSVHGQNIEMTCMICADVIALSGQREHIVTDIAVDESHPIQSKNNGCLTLYYPQAGEQAWDIGKRYSTSVQMILDENNLSLDEPLSGKMLLIPVVQ